MAGYSKLFARMYDGTLSDCWEALVTFQQMIILANRQGQVDMTVAALSRRTGVPREIIERGIEVLSAPDPDSRSPEEEGRRIALIDPDRPWGWRLVNYARYRDLLSREEKRTADRERIARKRAAAKKAAPDPEPAPAPDPAGKSQDVAGCRGVSRGVASVADVAHSSSSSASTALGSSEARLEDPAPREAASPTHPPGVSASMRTGPPPGLDGPSPPPAAMSAAGAACRAMRSAGLARTNPSHPDLLAAIEEGVPQAAWAPTTAECIERGKGEFAYVIAVARRRHQEGAARLPAVVDGQPRARASPSRRMEGLMALEALKSKHGGGEVETGDGLVAG